MGCQRIPGVVWKVVATCRFCLWQLANVVKCIDNTTNQVQLDQSAINGGRSGRLSWSRRWPPLEGLRFLLLQLLVLLLLKGQSVKHTGYGLLVRAHRLSSDAVLSTGSIATATDLCAPVIFELVQS